MSASTLDRVHRRRLATQRLSSAGLARGADVVRLLGCVQSQDAPLGAWSVGLRMPAGTTYADVLAEQAAGGWVRTHVLRPTWHLIAPEDLRWVQAITAAKVESSMAARHRGLGLDQGSVITDAFALLEKVLAGPTPMVRRELTAAFRDAGLPGSGEQVGHLLLTAELRSLICSGPPRGTEHTYVLVDEVVPAGAADEMAPEDARRELTRRFVRGHGPASERDLSRWSTLTLTEIRAALADLAPELERVEVDGHELWFDPSVPARTTREHAAYLLQTFDEVCLTYATTGFPRRAPDATRPRLLSEAGGGIVVLDGEDVGIWKRVVSPKDVRVTVQQDVPLDAPDRESVGAAAQRLADFLERPLDLAFT